jgi:16S rRNA (adenine1518-N6/adenine1519-N6)-dimethyltransferase
MSRLIASILMRSRPSAADDTASSTGPGEVLRARGLSPKKRLGQNFLVDPHAARVVADAVTAPGDATVVEIGAGLGALTRLLLPTARRVLAIERDRDLVPILEKEFGGAIQSGHLGLVTGDALDLDWGELLGSAPSPRVLAGNLPYFITGRLVERAIHLATSIDRAVFMVQAEVADRLLAAPDTESYGALTVFVQAAFDVRRLLTVKGGAFYPRPDVDSAVVVMTPRRPPRAEETPAFRSVVKAAFGARRKTLRNAWKGIFHWSRERLEQVAEGAGISLDVRGETLEVEAFSRVAAKAEAAEKGQPLGVSVVGEAAGPEPQ